MDEDKGKKANEPGEPNAANGPSEPSEANDSEGPDAADRPSGPDGPDGTDQSGGPSEAKETKAKRGILGGVGRFVAWVQRKVVAILSWGAGLFDPQGRPRYRVIHQLLAYLRDRVDAMTVRRFGCLLVAVVLLLGLGIRRILDRRWTSPNIAIWLSPIDDTDPNYLPDADDLARQHIGQGMERLFALPETKPKGLHGRGKVVQVQFGCYKTGKPGQYILRIRIPGVKRPEFEVAYESSDPNAPDLRRERGRIARLIRTHILETYPLRGICGTPDNNDVPLDIGSLAGVRAGDTFEVLRRKWFGIWVERNVGKLEVENGTDVDMTKCTAKIVKGADKIRDGDLVQLTPESAH